MCRSVEVEVVAFPRRPMWVYVPIWDASSWTMNDGKYRADYRFQHFVANFIARGCTATSLTTFRPPPSSSAGFGLIQLQRAAMELTSKFIIII
ncbi:hypothetical protein KFK09_004075 [Dendrobium nobile]|uniref:GH16 domain-containing protein n=1 Tax=Dendrobium nobile TaxID=94219 RepID=A0A8T3C1U6_DENNO|nr:hypothetical protein KFK09_004075 [Dendrobium nobile]